MGRNKTNIDWLRVITLGMEGHGVAKIAGMMGINRQSLCYRCQKDFACTVKELIRCGPTVMGGSAAAPASAVLSEEPASSGPIPDLVNTRNQIQWGPLREALEAGASDEEILCLTSIAMSELDKACHLEHGIAWDQWVSRVRASLDVGIRQAQLLAMRDGNITMLQLLGRERLGQGDTDKSDRDITEIRLVMCHGPEELQEVIAANKRAMNGEGK